MLFAAKPNTLEINGKKCGIDPDFRIMCDLTEKDKSALRRFYFAGLPEGVSIDDAVDGMFKFYKNGIAPDTGDDEGGKGSSRAPVFDFKEDEGYFYAAFLSEYGVDLNTVKMHWFDFCMLFRGLPDECKIKQMIGIRAAKINDIPKYDRKRIMKLKRLYALKGNRPKRYKNVEERDAAMLAAVNKRFEEVQKMTGGGQNG